MTDRDCVCSATSVKLREISPSEKLLTGELDATNIKAIQNKSVNTSFFG